MFACQHVKRFFVLYVRGAGVMARDVVLRIRSSGRVMPAIALIPEAHSAQCAISALAQMMQTERVRSRRKRHSNSQHSSLQCLQGAAAMTAALGTQRQRSGWQRRRLLVLRHTACAKYATRNDNARGRIT